jgi:integrase
VRFDPRLSLGLLGFSRRTIGDHEKGTRVRGGKAPTRDQYEAVLDYLLDLDPAEGVRRQGRWTLDHLIAKRRNVIDQALLQAATGLRSTEANLLTWTNATTDDEGSMAIRVTADIAKGGIPRAVLVLDDRVAERMSQRQVRARSKKEHMICSPADPKHPWDRDNRNKAARALYLEIADEVGIEVLENERSHMWRTTLHTLYGGSVPTAVLDTQFGNSEQVRAKHYTDPSDLSSLKAAARR